MIKHYSDHGDFYGPDGVLHSHENFTDEEAKAIVEETQRPGHKVAAHAIGSDGTAAALKLVSTPLNMATDLPKWKSTKWFAGEFIGFRRSWWARLWRRAAVELAEDGGYGKGGVPTCVEEGCEDRVGHGRGRLRLERAERG